jgi:galactokinase
LRGIPAARIGDFSDRIASPLFDRVRHVVHENERVLAAAGALRQSDFAAFGALMFDSHRSLSNSYAVSTDELDWAVARLAELPGVFGAKMTGGGFGGCVVALVDPPALYDVAGSLCGDYEQRFGTVAHAYRVHASDGASEIVEG